MQTTELAALPELEECLPPLSPPQLEQLRESLKENGMIHGITLCTIAERPGERFILDGHTRYRVARELGIAWKVDTDETPHFETIAAAVRWICKFQTARRNLTAEQYNLIMARCYRVGKLEVGANQHTSGRVDQNDPPSSTAEKSPKCSARVPRQSNEPRRKPRNWNRLGLMWP